jgi:hypothetical protein
LGIDANPEQRAQSGAALAGLIAIVVDDVRRPPLPSPAVELPQRVRPSLRQIADHQPGSAILRVGSRCTSRISVFAVRYLTTTAHRARRPD